ncbi:hypothetical protein FCV25MIE_31418 [Fagus crenata]
MLCSFAPMLSKLGLALLGHLIFTTFHPYRSINGYLLYFPHQSTAAIGRDPLGNIAAARTDRLPVCSILWAEAMAAWSVILLAQDFLALPFFKVVPAQSLTPFFLLGHLPPGA